MVNLPPFYRRWASQVRFTETDGNAERVFRVERLQQYLGFLDHPAVHPWKLSSQE